MRPRSAVRQHVGALRVTAAVLSACAVAACGGGRDRTGTPTDAGAGDGGAAGALAIDCIDRRNATDPRCRRPADVPLGSIGEGPAVDAIGGARAYGGFLDGRRVVLVVGLSSGGVVMAIDLDTGDRTIVSGSYEDPALGPRTAGAGDPFDLPRDVKPAPDGSWLVLGSSGLVRVDPATGDRSLAHAYSACAMDEAPIQIELAGFAIAEDGAIYLPVFSLLLGAGVMAIDGAGCRIVSWSSQPGVSLDRGTGPAIPDARPSGLRLFEGALWATDTLTASLYRIDPASGDRVRVSSDASGIRVGDGDAQILGGWLEFPSPGLAVASSNSTAAVRLTFVDLETGDRRAQEPILGALTAARESISPPLFLHPDGPWLVLGIEGALVVLDPATGNSFTLSR